MKFDYTMSTLHAADFFYYLQSAAELRFLLQHYPTLALAGSGAVLGLLAIWFVGCRIERTKLPLVVPAVGVITFSAALTWISYNRESDKHYRHFFDGFHIASFFVSFPDGIQFVRGSTLPHNSADPQQPLSSSESRSKPAQVPNIIVVLNESTINPLLYKKDQKYQVSEDLFRSGDGKAPTHTTIGTSASENSEHIACSTQNSRSGPITCMTCTAFTFFRSGRTFVSGALLKQSDLRVSRRRRIAAAKALA